MPYIGKKPADIIATVIDTTTGTFSGEVDAGSLDVSGNADIDGITNLDNTDIDGTLDVSGNLTVDTNTLFVDSSNNRVGVGTSSPGQLLHLSSSDPRINIEDTDAGGIFQIRNTSGAGYISTLGNHPMTFNTNSTEAMRIDSSGRLLVGKTSTDFNTEGMVISPTFVNLTRDGNPPLGLNRLNSNGDILQFYKDGGSAVGSIGTESGRVFMYGNATYPSGIRFGNNVLEPSNSSGTARDALTSLGSSSGRFKDLYLSSAARALEFVGVNDTDTGMQVNDTNIIKFSTANGERVRIDGSGNLLVGTTGILSMGSSTTAGFQVGGDFRGVRTDGSPIMYLKHQSNDGTFINFYKDTSSVGNIGVNSGGTYFAGNGSSLLSLGDAVLPRSITGGSRNGLVDLGNSANVFNNLYINGGVYLGGTGSANFLDSYEEGTFDPTVFIGATEVTSYHFQYGSYTKVGRMVHLNLWFRVNNKGAATGNISIRGLPFAVPNSSDFNTAATVGYQDEMASSSAPIMAYAVKNTSQINLNYTTATGRTPITQANLNNGQMMIQVSYPTT